MANYDGTTGNDTLIGAAPDDVMTGGDGNDSILGNAGNDSITGDAGNDVLNGGIGNDTVRGGDGNDNLSGLDGNDLMDGGADNDSMVGGNGNDMMLGGSGNDRLGGDAGNDTLDGGTGNDYMAGGAGADVYYVDSTTDEVYEADSALGDKVYATASFTLTANVETLELLDAGGNINGKGSTGANTLIGNTGNNQLRGDAGNDTISGGDGADTIVGGAGKDSMTGGTGADVFMLRASNETTVALTSMDVITDFVPGTDKIDVSMIDAKTTTGFQGATFIGTASAFTTANAHGGIRWDATNHVLWGSTDADIAAEWGIYLPGVSTITAGDLILTDTVAPIFTSGGSVSLNENAGAGKIVYRSTIEDGTATYTLGGPDAALFKIVATTGVVTLVGNPNFEAKASYSFTVTATDPAGNPSVQAVTLSINNIDEVRPTITSPATGNVDENTTVLYTATGDDSGDVSAGIKWSLAGTDATLLNIDANTGVVTRKSGALDHETKSTYTFTVVAKDGVTTQVTKAVVVTLNDLDELAPIIDSGATGTAVTENTAVPGVVYTIAAHDNPADVTGPLTYSLIAGNANFSLAGNQVTLTVPSPDYEVAHSYSFTFRVQDAAGNYKDKTVVVEIKNVDEVAPVITSPNSGSVSENQNVLYTATSTDTDVVSGSTTYSIVGGADAALVGIGAGSGVVTLNSGNLNLEAKEFYTFKIRATDGAGHYDEKTVTITVNDINEFAPELVSPAVFSPTGITYTVEDDDGNSQPTPLAYMSPFSLLGTVNDGTPTTLNATEQATVLQGDVAVTDGLNFIHVQAFMAMGTAGNDVLDATTSNYPTNRAALYGFGGNDTITGTDNDDQLSGGTGNDSLTGGDGNDLLAGGTGNDWFNVTAGTDSASDIGEMDGIRVEAGAQLDGDITSDLTLAAGSYNYGTANLTTAGHNVDLSAADASTLGFNVDNSGGAATIVGASGNDTIAGGAGNDTIVGGDGDDTLVGLQGLDSIVGGTGVDTLDGGADNDTLTGGSSDDRFVIGAGTDSVTDLSGSDVMVVSAGATVNATVTAAYTATAATTNQGTANITTTSTPVDFSGATVFGTLGYNILNNGTAGTTLTGSGGRDTITGDIGADTINGGAGNDTIYGGQGDDSIDGGTDNDYIDAGAGNNTVTGGGGNDTLLATNGNMYIGDLGGNDVLMVGAGSSVTATIASTGWTPTSASYNNGTVSLTTNGYAVDLSNVTGTSGWTVTNNGAATTITGSNNADTLNGGAGNDTLLGRGGDDSISGNGGDDSLVGGGDNDTVLGGAGNDVLTGGAGNDNMAGGADHDTLSGGNDADTLSGDAGDDSLVGGGGNDSLVSGTGTDAMTGDGGDDTFRVSSGSTATISDVGDTGGSNDAIVVEAGGVVTGTVTANWNPSTASSNSGTATLNSAGFRVNLSSATGTSGWSVNNTGGAARFQGSANADSLTGNAGADTLEGNGGADTLVGNAGTDSIMGGAGNDSLVGGNDADTLVGGADDDTLSGGAGDDTFTIANNSTDSITDLGGSDVFTVAAGATAIAQVTSNFTATSGTNNLGTSTLTTDSGIHVDLSGANAATLGFTVMSGGGNATLTGSAGNDSILGNAGNDTVNGGAGADTVWGGFGSDSIDGGNDADWLRGEGDADNIAGGGGADDIAGGDGADTVTGDAGNDTIAGDADADSLSGGADDDTIWGGTGDDTIDGGTGADRLMGESGADSIVGGDGNDTMLGGAISDTMLGGNDDDDMSGELGDDSLDGGAGNDKLYGHAENDWLTGGAGDDLIDGGADTDTADYSAETAAITVDLGAGTATGAGTDTLVDIENVKTGSGADLIGGSSGDNVLDGGEGNDTFTGDAGGDWLLGGDGTDTADYSAQTAALAVDLGAGTANGAGIDMLDSIENFIAGSGDDDITGSSGVNVLDGGEGNDTFAGAGGDDTIDGGDGDDTAVFSGNVADYEVAVTSSGFTVTDTVSGDVSTVDNVELLEFADTTLDVSRPVQLVSGGFLAGTFDTIQEAIDAASDGDTINVAAGEYNENVVIDKEVTIQGAGSGTVIMGDLLETNDNSGTYDYFVDWLTGTGASAYTTAGVGVGMQVQADNVTLKDLTISNFTQGVDIDGVTISDLTLEGVTLNGNLMGLRVNGSTDVTNFTMMGGEITNGYQGVIVNHGGSGALTSFDNVLFDGVHFEHLAEKGIYVEAMNDGVLQDLTFDDVGNYGRAQPMGGVGMYGAAIDINLKYGSYSNIQMIDLDIENSAQSSGSGSTSVTGAAIQIKARDDSPSYSGVQASATGISITGGEIDGAPVAIRIGELNTANAAVVNAGPDVTITGVTFTDNTIVLTDTTNSPMDLSTLAGTNTITGSSAAEATSDRGGATLFIMGAGDDSVGGGAGDDRIDGGNDTDLVDYSGQSSAVTVDLGSGTASGTGIGSDTLISIENASGGSGADALTGSSGDNVLSGAGGNDTFTGGAGDDTIDGGAGDADMAVFAGNAADYTIAPVSGGFAVTHTSSGDVDTVKNVELLDFDDATIDASGAVQVFRAGSLVGTYDTIQDAVDASSDGDTINVSAGEYNENVVVDKEVTIQGASGGGTVLMGTLLETNYGGSSYDYFVDWLTGTSAASYSTSGVGVGMQIAADDVTLKDLTIRNFTQGVDIGGVTIDGLTLDGVTLDGNLMGLRVDLSTHVSNFTMTGGEITNGYQGVIVNHGGSGALTSFDDVLFDGVHFEHLAEKGIYVEAMNDGVLQDLTFDDVGNYGRAQPFGGVGMYGAAIDINLKYGAYDNIQMIDLEIENSALSNGAGYTQATGAAIQVKTRDDGSYNAVSASATNISITGGSIDGAPVAIRIGELNTSNVAVVNNGPDVTITGVTFTNDGVVLTDTTATPMNLASLIANNTILAPIGPDAPTDIGGATLMMGGAGSDTLVGGAGNDLLNGGADADSLTGGANADTFRFDTTDAADTITDFATGTDTIQLEDAVFTAVQSTGGVLDASNFTSGAGVTATTADHHILFDTSTSTVYYDADGNGAGAAVAIAVLTTGTVVASDFTVF